MGTVRYTVIDGEIIAEKRNGVRKQYVPDSQGSTVALLDNTQTQTDTFTYWPYGEVASRTGTTPTPFQYVGTRGYRQDRASKTYVRARVLDTQKGRWLTEDPIGFSGGDGNLYRYVKNSPVIYVDYTGNAWNYDPPWLFRPVTPGDRKRAATAWKCLHDSAFTDPIFSVCRNQVGAAQIFWFMMCIIGCETANAPSSNDPFIPDYIPHTHTPMKPGPGVGVGPCRLSISDGDYLNQHYKGWDSKICPNIRAGVDLYCKWKLGKAGVGNTWPKTTAGPCFKKCMVEKL